MMYFQLIVSSIFIHFVSAADLSNILNKDGNKGDKALVGSNARTNTGRKSPPYQLWNHQFWKPRKGAPYNITYIDRAENLIRVPELNKLGDKKAKKKTLKKTPKRTIQKIIKKNSKSKIKKIYRMRMTSSATMMPNFDNDDQEDYSLKNSEVTKRPNQQKKIKKYSVKQVKLPRYPLPFKKMQTKKNNNKRPKRETRDVFIINDFDSMKFLKGKKEDDEDDYNIVDAHIKNYW